MSWPGRMCIRYRQEAHAYLVAATRLPGGAHAAGCVVRALYLLAFRLLPCGRRRQLPRPVLMPAQLAQGDICHRWQKHRSALVVCRR